MKLIAHRLDGTANEYIVPSADEALAYSRKTLDTQFDQVERKKITGGLPMVWQRVQ